MNQLELNSCVHIAYLISFFNDTYKVTSLINIT